MYLAYDGIVFDVLLLNGWDQNAITSEDGVDFLYWHHIIDVTVILNPEVNSASFFPQQQTVDVDRFNVRRIVEQNRLIKQRDDQLELDKLKADTSGENPVKTAIQINDPKGPRSDININEYPDPSDDDDFFLDSLGTVSEKVGTNGESYKPDAFAAPGIPYSPDLAKKTGVIKEASGGNWRQSDAPFAAAPSNYVATTNKFSVNPEKIFETIPFLPPAIQPFAGFGVAVIKNAAVDIQNAVGDFIAGEQRPPNLLDVAGAKTSRTDPPGKGKRVRFPANSNLPSSEIELRDRLQNPRRKLAVWVNTGPGGSPEFLLSLPYDGCTVDAKHGPRCVDMKMVAVHGNVTGVKRLVFECFEAVPITFGVKKVGDKANRLITPDKNVQKPGARLVPLKPEGKNELKIVTPPIISNRWEMKQVPDQTTKLNTIVISGKAVFRMDVLTAMQITPDQLRSYIMPPVATGYVRRPPEVSLGSGSNEILYTIVDDQQMLNNPSGVQFGVHSVIVVDKVEYNSPVEVFTTPFQSEKFGGHV